jgi:hypothetical protein
VGHLAAVTHIRKGCCCMSLNAQGLPASKPHRRPAASTPVPSTTSPRQRGAVIQSYTGTALAALNAHDALDSQPQSRPRLSMTLLNLDGRSMQRGEARQVMEGAVGTAPCAAAVPTQEAVSKRRGRAVMKGRGGCVVPERPCAVWRSGP